jgi:deoxyribose-phosphate aldolase
LPSRFPGFPNVGALCVYPSLISEVTSHLKAEGVGIVSVGAGFPASQTFTEIKLAECVMAVKAGATEIDIVISLGKFLEGDYNFVASEIRQIKDAIGSIKLKVILETGLLQTAADIYKASEVSIQSGADFIKTSTGKLEPAASPEAVYIMCLAIRNHYKATGIRTGIKPAGGISTPEQALQYMSVVRSVLGDEWLHPGLFRIGASRLVNKVLEDLHFKMSGKHVDLKYF